MENYNVIGLCKPDMFRTGKGADKGIIESIGVFSMRKVLISFAQKHRVFIKN